MSQVQMTNLRRDVFAQISEWPMTANEVSQRLGIDGNSSTSVDRVLSWACREGFAVRAGSVRIERRRGLHSFSFKITERGLAALAAMPAERLRSARAKVWVAA